MSKAEPNKYERAGKLLNALAKIDAAEKLALETVGVKFAAKRAALVEEADAEVQELVAQERGANG